MNDSRPSRRERILLSEIEAGLADDDPAFVVRFGLDALALGELPRRSARPRWFPRVYWDDPS
jgi:hypothetical protein